MPSDRGVAQVRFVDGAPALEALIGGVPTDIGAAYLSVDGASVVSSFRYGTIAPFVPIAAGVHSLEALDSLGYFVGPLDTPALSAGKSYTIVVVGQYPNYRALAFDEPNAGSGAFLTLYEAAPSVPSADFGSFSVSKRGGYRKRGSADFGSVVTVPLGAHVSDFGAYAGKGTTPFVGGAIAASSVDPFDLHSQLPFHNAHRFSLFLFDPVGSNGSTFARLDP